MPYTVSKTAARKFLLQKQLLLPPKQLKGYQGISQVMRRLRVIQYDPLNPCGRNPDLVFQARIKDYRVSDYYSWLYGRRRGVECYDKELCLIPKEDAGLCPLKYSLTDQTRTSLFMKKHGRELNKLLQQIRNKGETSSLELLDKRKVDIWWGPTQWGKAALDSLWRLGKLVIASRKSNRKYFHMPAAVYGKGFGFPAKETKKLFPVRILRRVNAVGMLSASGTGTGWLGLGTGAVLRPYIEKLVKNNRLAEIRINGSEKPYVILKKDLGQLEKSLMLSVRRPVMTFLAPLDNLLWDRRMVKEIFDFEYTWEVYVPKHKRKHGYYILPILYGDKLVARFEPVKRDNTLLIKGFWLEQGIKWDKKLQKAFVSALKDFQKYTQTSSEKWMCQRPGVDNHNL